MMALFWNAKEPLQVLEEVSVGLEVWYLVAQSHFLSSLCFLTMGVADAE